MKRSLLLLMSLLCMYCTAFSQKVITGKVTDTKGEALKGVTVLEKGKNTQTATSSIGAYKITVSDGATLIF